jgi:hypothetical protein
LRDEQIESIVKSEVQNMIKIARAEARKIHVAELGVVTKVFPHSEGDKNNYECDVKLRDKDITLEKVPVATQQIGLANMPHEQDLVLVTFINGDINSPIVIGRLYNDKDRPPEFNEEEIIYKPPYSKSEDLKRLYIELPGESLKVTLSEKGVDISTDADVVIHSSGNTTIKCDGGISLQAGDISLESQKSMTIKSSGEVTIQGAVVKIN